MEEIKSNPRAQDHNSKANYYKIVSGHGDPYMEFESIGNHKVNKPAQKTGTEDELLKRRKHEVQKAELHDEIDYEKEIEDMKKKAQYQLENFPLQNLKMTKAGTFNMTYSDSKEYIRLCNIIEVDPDEYYHANKGQVFEQNKPQVAKKSIEKTNYGVQIESKVPEKKKNVTKQENSSQNSALQKLKAFSLKELVYTKSGEFDKRRKTTKEYLSLCDAAGVKPDEYYFANFMGEPQNEREAQVFDNRNQDPVRQQMEESQRKLNDFDRSQLKFRADGELDKRFNINKEYLSLQEQCKESYYKNM